MAGSPTMRRRRLAAELRRLRNEAGLTIDEASSALGWPPSKISRTENRQYGISASDVRKMLDLYGVKDQEQRGLLSDLARRANERGWWQSFKVDSTYANLIGLEEEASSIRWYEPELVPGLLQTEDYAREIIRAGWRSLAAEEIDGQVEVRIARQAILKRDTPPPPQVTVILNEGVLRRQAGGAETMRAQLVHLATCAEWENVTIQVLPFTAGAHATMVGPFQFLEFPDPSDPGVVTVENIMGTLAMEKPDERRGYGEAWHAIQALALSPADSRTVINSFALR
jgi:transcriptional regulator with XRE-family HTH domain